MNKMVQNIKEHFFIYIYVLLLAIGVIYDFNKKEIREIFALSHSKAVVIIDAGHGGFDPGVIGNDMYEKDVNLEIALKLQEYLEQSGAYVYMTRTDDSATANTKKKDMLFRKSFTNGSNADILISIHQNSFTDSKVNGSQVFYYDNSEKSKILALNIQEQLNIFANPTNNKKAMPTSTYYLLRETNIPAVIVECGFLTSPDDSYKLSTDEYKDKLAWSIYVATLKYFDDIK